MIKLWRSIMLPMCEAVQAKTILEIGAEYGTSTHALLRYVSKHDGHLHCIDPYPSFEAEAFAAENAAHISYYRKLSLECITDIPPVDVAMVDGDHNWYTVYNELKQLESVHGADPVKQPLIFLHDLGWPYGRRDLYYNPETIPDAFRQPYARQGMLPKKSALVEGGGMNCDLCNATHEGGPRNGVLTGVEDYLEESELEWCFMQLPLYYGLGVMVTRARLAESPLLQAQLDRFELSEGAEQLVRQAEHLRCTDGIMMQAINRKLLDAQARIEQLEAQVTDAATPPKEHS